MIEDRGDAYLEIKFNRFSRITEGDKFGLYWCAYFHCYISVTDGRYYSKRLNLEYKGKSQHIDECVTDAIKNFYSGHFQNLSVEVEPVIFSNPNLNDIRLNFSELPDEIEAIFREAIIINKMSKSTTSMFNQKLLS